jgi:deoxycytidine triphosphate deaminase
VRKITEIDDKIKKEREKEHSAIIAPSVAKGKGYYFWIPKDKTDFIDPNSTYLVKFQRYKKIEKKKKSSS